MKYFRHLHLYNNKWYVYDFLATDMASALLFAAHKFTTRGIVGEIA